MSSMTYLVGGRQLRRHHVGARVLDVAPASISGYGVYCTSQIRSRSRHPSSKLRVKSIICNWDRVQDN